MSSNPNDMNKKDELSTDVESMDKEPVKREFPEGKIICPDCEKEFDKPEPGFYRCPVCYCKFSVGYDSEVKIIPYFSEMHLEPILMMLGVLGLVLLFAAGDGFMALGDRLSLFSIIMISVYGLYRLIGYFCLKKRGVDRFFRRWSRSYEENYKNMDTLIRVEVGDQTKL